MLPMEVLQIPASEADLLQRFWNHEPWGPWRDNLHAAVVARASMVAGGLKPPKLDAFMYRIPDPNAAAGSTAAKSFVDMMKTIAVRKRRKKKP